MQQVAPIDTGGPVYPGKVMDVFEMNKNYQMELVYSSGLTVRDHFAGLFMQGIFASGNLDNSVSDEEVAAAAYKAADAMLKARKS